jgi:hypothetical protein
MNEQTIEIQVGDSRVALKMSQDDYARIGSESEQFLAKLLQSVPPDEPLSKIAAKTMDSNWASSAYQAMWAAAYQRRKAYAERIFVGCHLNGVQLVESDVGGLFPCPVCFEVPNPDSDLSCGHLVYGPTMSDVLTELPCADILQSLDDILDELDMDAGRLKKLKEVQDIALVLMNVEQARPWFLGFNSLRELRTFSFLCDIDRWGDTYLLGFHPEPEQFRNELERLRRHLLDQITALEIV